MPDIKEIINKCLDNAIREVDKDWKERIGPFIEKAKMSIKHPHFYYVVVDTKTMTYEFKRKKMVSMAQWQKNSSFENTTY